MASSAQGVMILNNGDSVSLAAVLASNDRKIAINDKIFTLGAYTSDTFSAGNVFLTAFIAANPLDGIGFDLTGGFGDVNPADTLASQFHLAYTVNIDPEFLGRGYRLKDIALVFNGSATGQGSTATVHEAVSDATSTALGALDVFAIGGGPIHQQDFRDFSLLSYPSFSVDTVAQFLAASPNGSASASFIRQTFSQVITPAPGTAALLGMGGLLATRRRRQV